MHLHHDRTFYYLASEDVRYIVALLWPQSVTVRL